MENDSGSVPLSFCSARLFSTCLIKVDCQDTTDERKFHILILVKYMVLCKEIYVVFFKVTNLPYYFSFLHSLEKKDVAGQFMENWQYDHDIL